MRGDVIQADVNSGITAHLASNVMRKLSVDERGKFLSAPVVALISSKVE